MADNKKQRSLSLSLSSVPTDSKISPRECESCKQITTLQSPRHQPVLFFCNSCCKKYEKRNSLSLN